jgi:hypothetical protein
MISRLLMCTATLLKKHGALLIVLFAVALASAIHIRLFFDVVVSGAKSSALALGAQLCAVMIIPLVGLWLGRKTTAIAVEFSLRRAFAHAFILNLLAVLFAIGYHYYLGTSSPVFYLMLALVILIFATIILSLGFFYGTDTPAFGSHKKARSIL